MPHRFYCGKPPPPRDPEFYASVEDGRVAESGDPIKAPIVGVCDGRIGVQNGRHRARAALLLGRKTIPIVVDKDNVAELRELLARFR
jgi:hypothetical protein